MCSYTYALVTWVAKVDVIYEGLLQDVFDCHFLVDAEATGSHNHLQSLRVYIWI